MAKIEATLEKQREDNINLADQSLISGNDLIDDQRREMYYNLQNVSDIELTRYSYETNVSPVTTNTDPEIANHKEVVTIRGEQLAKQPDTIKFANPVDQLFKDLSDFFKAVPKAFEAIQSDISQKGIMQAIGLALVMPTGAAAMSVAAGGPIAAAAVAFSPPVIAISAAMVCAGYFLLRTVECMEHARKVQRQLQTMQSSGDVEPSTAYSPEI